MAAQRGCRAAPEARTKAKLTFKPGRMARKAANTTLALDQARFSRLTNGCAWNAVSAFANCGRAVAHVRGSYVPIGGHHSGIGRCRQLQDGCKGQSKAYCPALTCVRAKGRNLTVYAARIFRDHEAAGIADGEM